MGMAVFPLAYIYVLCVWSFFSIFFFISFFLCQLHKLTNMNTIYNTKFPYLGMKINSIRESPSIEMNGYVFCGTWYRKNGSQDELIGITWQNTKTGLLISDEQFKKIVFNF